MIRAIESDEDFEDRVGGFGKNVRLAFVEALAIEKMAEYGNLGEVLEYFGERHPGRVMTGPGWASVVLAELDDWVRITLLVCPGWALVSVGRDLGRYEYIDLSARAERQLQDHFGIEPDPGAHRA